MIKRHLCRDREITSTHPSFRHNRVRHNEVFLYFVNFSNRTLYVFWGFWWKSTWHGSSQVTHVVHRTLLSVNGLQYEWRQYRGAKRLYKGQFSSHTCYLIDPLSFNGLQYEWRQYRGTKRLCKGNKKMTKVKYCMIWSWADWSFRQKYIRNHIWYSSSFIITFHHYRTVQRNNTTGAVYGAGNAYPSGEPDFTPGFKWSSCCLLFIIYNCWCKCPLILWVFFYSLVLIVIVLNMIMIWIHITSACFCIEF